MTTIAQSQRIKAAHQSRWSSTGRNDPRPNAAPTHQIALDQRRPLPPSTTKTAGSAILTASFIAFARIEPKQTHNPSRPNPHRARRTA